MNHSDVCVAPPVELRQPGQAGVEIHWRIVCQPRVNHHKLLAASFSLLGLLATELGALIMTTHVGGI